MHSNPAAWLGFASPAFTIPIFSLTLARRLARRDPASIRWGLHIYQRETELLTIDLIIYGAQQ